MKKTLLISTALFLASASFAQTKANSTEALKDKTSFQQKNAGTNVSSSQNSSSATTIHSGIVKNAKDGSSAKIKEENTAMANEKQAMAAKAKMKSQQVENAASKDRSVSVSTKANTKINASAKGNNLNENSSSNSKVTVSDEPIKSKIGNLNNSEKENESATIKGANHSKTVVNETAVESGHKINTASSAKVHTTFATVQKVHVKAIRIKDGAQVKTITGIRIK